MKKLFENVFVTVGTTAFDDLVAEITNPVNLKLLSDLGCRKLLLQIGRGEESCVNSSYSGNSSVHVEYYRFKPSLTNDLQSADLVIECCDFDLCLNYVISSLLPNFTTSLDFLILKHAERIPNSIGFLQTLKSILKGHAGAGTCLESLELQKPLLVIINEKLHDNHQLELAEKLSEESHLIYCTPKELSKFLADKTLFSNLQVFRPGNPKLFTNWLDDYLGFNY